MRIAGLRAEDEAPQPDTDIGLRAARGRSPHPHPAARMNSTLDPMEIRKLSVDDIHALAEIGKRTFAETFSSGNSEENMANYLAGQFSAERLGRELADPQADFYFAEIEGRVVGYLKLNSGPSQTELQDGNSVEIERIYVLREFQGKKVGQALYETALESARTKNADYVWLGVWERNPRAIRFYEKNGFVAFDTHIFRLGDDDQTDIMMKLDLNQEKSGG